MQPFLTVTRSDGTPLVSCPTCGKSDRLFTRTVRLTEKQRAAKNPTIKTEYVCGKCGVFPPA